MLLMLALLVVVHCASAFELVTEDVTVTTTSTELIPTTPSYSSIVSTAIDIPGTPTTLAFSLASVDSSDIPCSVSTSCSYTVYTSIEYTTAAPETLTPDTPTSTPTSPVSPTTTTTDTDAAPTETYSWLEPATYSLFSYDLFIMLGFALCWALGGFRWWAGEQRSRARWVDEGSLEEVDWDVLESIFGVQRPGAEREETQEERLHREMRRMGMV